MPVGHFTPQPSNNSSKTCVAVPDAVIEDFLGSGLSSSEWPAEVTKRGYAWYPGLKNIIIEKQWERFKPEIQRLQSEPKIAQSSRFKSNSLESISKRLKGEPWAEGRPDEREERLRTRRLLGKDAGYALPEISWTLAAGVYVKIGSGAFRTMLPNGNKKLISQLQNVRSKTLPALQLPRTFQFSQ